MAAIATIECAQLPITAIMAAYEYILLNHEFLPFFQVMISSNEFTRLIWLFLLNNNFLAEISFHIDLSIEKYLVVLICIQVWWARVSPWREKKSTMPVLRRSNISSTIFVTCSYLQCHKCTRSAHKLIFGKFKYSTQI